MNIKSCESGIASGIAVSKGGGVGNDIMIKRMIFPQNYLLIMNEIR